MSMIFFNYIYSIDLFKTPLTLLFNKKRFISTKFGFVCSLAIISIMIVMALKSDLFEKAFPQIINSNLPITDRPLIKLTNKILAVGVQDDVYFKGFVDNSIYSIKISNYFYNANASGGYFFRSTQTKNFHICNEDDFDNPETFTNLGLANNFCLDKEDNNLELEGYYDEPTLKYVLIELFLCNNLTSNKSCKSYEEMENGLNGKSFNIYFEDTIIDTKNYEDPIKHMIVNEYSYIDIGFRKNLDLYFQDVSLNSDDGWLFSNETEYSDIGYVSQASDFFSVISNNSDISRFAINIYSDKKKQTIQRTYTKVSDLLAKLGGMVQSLMLLAYMFIHIEHSLFLKNTILNSLYVFQRKDCKTKFINKVNKSIGLNFNHKINANSNFAYKVKNLPIYPMNILNKTIKNSIILETIKERKITKLNKLNSDGVNIDTKNWFKSAFFARKKKILEYQIIKEKPNSTQKLNFGILKYILLKLKSIIPIFKMTFEEELFKKSEKIYENELDYIEILKKLQDVEKLKKILLNPKQLILFEFLSKPLLHLNERRDDNLMMNSINLDNRANKNKEDLKKALDFYDDLKNEGNLLEIDKRLISLFNEDIKNLR